MAPDFVTKRLRVFCVELSPSDVNLPRSVFIACRNDEDRPMVCATAVVWRESPLGAWVEWVEVSTAHRRMGIGTELVRGIGKHLKVRLEMAAVTDEGSLLLAKLARMERKAAAAGRRGG